MDKKIICITGAAKGIGAKVAEIFAKNGYNIILHYNSSSLLAENLKRTLEQKYVINVYLYQADLSKEDEINALINYIKSITDHLDVLVNNAAISLDCDISLKSKKEFVNVLEVNLIAPFILIRGLSSILNSSVVINISSTDGIDTGSTYNIDYSVSKAGLNNLTQILSIVYTNIRIYALAPNWVKTESILEMDPEFLKSELKRVGQKELISPNEIAKKIFDLVNNDNLPSGSVVRMDGNSG